MINVSISELKEVMESTTNKKDVESIKQKFYIDTIKSTITMLFKVEDNATAFIESIKYLADLQNANTLNEKELEEISTFIHLYGVADFFGKDR